MAMKPMSSAPAQYALGSAGMSMVELTALVLPTLNPEFVVRFWQKVDKYGPVHPVLGTSCWLWTGAVQTGGYGQAMDGRRNRLAHRASWELRNGVIPRGLMVLHACDNPPCVRPVHLFLGSQLDNMRDKVAKRRQATGERNGGGHRLTESQVLAIRGLVEDDGCSKAEVARAFSVSQTAVGYIIRRRLWKDLQ